MKGRSGGRGRKKSRKRRGGQRVSHSARCQVLHTGRPGKVKKETSHNTVTACEALSLCYFTRSAKRGFSQSRVGPNSPILQMRKLSLREDRHLVSASTAWPQWPGETPVRHCGGPQGLPAQNSCSGPPATPPQSPAEGDPKVSLEHEPLPIPP